MSISIEWNITCAAFHPTIEHLEAHPDLQGRLGSIDQVRFFEDHWKVNAKLPPRSVYTCEAGCGALPVLWSIANICYSLYIEDRHASLIKNLHLPEGRQINENEMGVYLNVITNQKHPNAREDVGRICLLWQGRDRGSAHRLSWGEICDVEVGENFFVGWSSVFLPFSLYAYLPLSFNSHEQLFKLSLNVSQCVSGVA